MDHLRKVMPENGMTLDYPPQNLFMPSADRLKMLRKERVEPDKPGNPNLIEDKDFELWHKQDDTFEQPFIFMHAKITCNDCDVPLSSESGLLSYIWIRMLEEHLRELKYMADLAGIQ